VLLFDICLYGRTARQISAHSSEVFDPSQNARLSSSLLHTVDGERDPIQVSEFGGLGLSIDAQVLAYDSLGTPNEVEWDASPYFRFF
jgi:hypothetical protein